MIISKCLYLILASIIISIACDLGREEGSKIKLFSPDWFAQIFIISVAAMAFILIALKDN